MWIKCIYSQTVRLFNQNHPGEEIFRGVMMSDQDLEWQQWVLLPPKQSVIKRRCCLSTASPETSFLKGKFVYSTVVSTFPKRTPSSRSHLLCDVQNCFKAAQRVGHSAWGEGAACLTLLSFLSSSFSKILTPNRKENSCPLRGDVLWE